MPEFKISDNRPRISDDRPRTPESPLEPTVKRSGAAAEKFAKHGMGSTDPDAFMALHDFASDPRTQAEARAEAEASFEGADENKTMHAVPGRPDLVFIKGRGVGGCSYIVISRRADQPVRAQVLDESRSWAEQEDEEGVTREQLIELRERR